jgi:hypothetical protein
MRFTPVASSNAVGADSTAEPQEPLSLILQVASTRLPGPAVFLSAVTNSRGWILRKPWICTILQRRSRGAFAAPRPRTESCRTASGGLTVAIRVGLTAGDPQRTGAPNSCSPGRLNSTHSLGRHGRARGGQHDRDIDRTCRRHVEESRREI